MSPRAASGACGVSASRAAALSAGHHAGATLWDLAAPAEVSCISAITLTSTGGIVGVGCVDFQGLDGEVYAFGASD